MANKSIIIALLILIAISGCTHNTTGSVISEQIDDLEINLANNLETIVITQDTPIPPAQCSERGLNDKIIMLESAYCGHCKIAKMILEQIAQEKELNILFLDVSKDEDRNRMENDFHVTIRYTPTLLVGCNVIIGSRDKEEYEQIIDEFLVN